MHMCTTFNFRKSKNSFVANGFNLTVFILHDKYLGELPLILSLCISPLEEKAHNKRQNTKHFKKVQFDT